MFKALLTVTGVLYESVTAISRTKSPASLGVPALFGPYMSNFKEITALVLENRAGIQVATREALGDTLRRLFSNPAERESLRNHSLAMMRDNGGSTEKHLNCIAGLLKLN